MSRKRFDCKSTAWNQKNTDFEMISEARPVRVFFVPGAFTTAGRRTNTGIDRINGKRHVLLSGNNTHIKNHACLEYLSCMAFIELAWNHAKELIVFHLETIDPLSGSMRGLAVCLSLVWRHLNEGKGDRRSK